MSKCRYKWHFYIQTIEVGQSFKDDLVVNYGNQQLEALWVDSAWK